MNTYSADEAWCESKERFVKAEVAERLYEELKNMVEVSRYISHVDRESALEAINFADNN